MRAKIGLVFSVIFCGFLLAGCFPDDIQPSYKEADIPVTIKKICREEFKLRVLPIRVGNTLWVYAPQPRLLHADFGKKPEKIFDEDLLDKARNILTSISRVLLSSDKAPDFFVLVLSDINIGLDYSLTANILDIKKSAAGMIPWNEANKRYVIGFEQSVDAKGDVRGEHLKVYDLKLAEFLSRLIVQRVRMFFQEEPIKKYFSLKDVNAGFRDKVFTFEYSTDKKLEPKENPDIPRAILNSIVYCFKTYEFKDFARVKIRNLQGGAIVVYESKDIQAISIE
ncbi:MAG: hypothetical protein NTY14_07275 [Candidatus Omnitrophica bacterium]|nr:hypothetical protein [Candidatus Omnitrophota bacterium]